MIREPGPCDAELINALLSGELDDTSERQLTDHLDVCAQCRQSLEVRSADAAVWKETGELLKEQPFDAESCFDVSLQSDDSFDDASPMPLSIRNVLQSLGPTDDPNMLGRLGGYEVMGVVGAGGMGVVLKGLDRSLDRTVAIKVLAPHLASSGAARKRFAREAKAAAAVLHPNVIAIHGVSDGADQVMLPYLVMPYVRGSSLQARIDKNGPLTLTETLRVAAQIVDGLAAEREAAKLADRWRREKAKGRLMVQEMDQLRMRVSEQVAAAFSSRQQIKRNDLAKATAQLKTIRERLDSRQKIADQIVQRRVEDLLGEVDLSWLTAKDRAENDAFDAADLADLDIEKIAHSAKNPNIASKIMSQMKEAEGNVQLELLNDLGTIVIRGRKGDVERVMEVIKAVEEADSNPLIRGKVIKINSEKGSILLDIGTDQGLQLKVPLDVFRNGKPIGRMEVISVAPKDSIARVLTTKSDYEVAVGDEVRANSRQSESTPAQP